MMAFVSMVEDEKMEASVETQEICYTLEETIEPVIQEEAEKKNIFEVWGLSAELYYSIRKHSLKSDNN